MRAPALHRCKAETSVLAIGLEFSRAFGVGALVDLEEHVAPGVKLRDLVRLDCFEPTSSPEPAAPPAEDDQS